MRRSSGNDFSSSGDDVGDEIGDLDVGTLLGYAATGVAQAANVDPGTIKAAQDVLSSPIAKAGFNAGLSAAVQAVKGDNKPAPAPAPAPTATAAPAPPPPPPPPPPTPAAIHADPNVKAAKALLPTAAAKAGFDKAVSLVAGHAAGAAEPGLSPSAQAANLIAAGTPKTSWLRLGLATVVPAGGAFLLGATLPITLIAAIVGPTALHAFGKDKVTT